MPGLPLGCGRAFQGPSCSSRPKRLGPAQTRQAKAVLSNPSVGVELPPGPLPYRPPHPCCPHCVL